MSLDKFIIYDGCTCRMQGVFFKKAVTFICDTMMPCSFATHIVDEMEAINVRLTQKKQNQTDLYFLKDLQVLFQCSWQDWLKEESRPDRLSERGKGHQRTMQELETLLPQIIEDAENNLTTESVLQETGDVPSALQLTSKLEHARSEAAMLEQSLGAILREMRGETASRKRGVSPLAVCLRELKEL